MHLWRINVVANLRFFSRLNAVGSGVPARGDRVLGVCPHRFMTTAARADLYRQPTIMSF